MEFKEYFTERTTVDIVVVKLNNQKLTKSIFKQIQISQFIDHDLDFENIKILGLVRDNNLEWIVYLYQNRLLRQSTDFISEINEVFVSSSKVEDISDYIEGLYNYNPRQKISTLPKEKQDEFVALKAKVNEFYRVLLDKQFLL